MNQSTQTVTNSIEKEIYQWADQRPIWQQNLLKRIARGEVIDDSYITEVVQNLLDDSTVLEEPPLKLEELPSGAVGGTRSTLRSVGELENVNALLGGHTLEFEAEGLTLVYGDNGSGKSGYARLVKAAVEARHQHPILPNAYGSDETKQSAVITYLADDSVVKTSWPESSDASLKQIHFYDEACGDDYLERETILSYRPSVLTLLDQMIVAIDQVKGRLGDLITEKESNAYQFPAVPAETESEKFLDALSNETTQETISTFLTLPEGSEEEYAGQVQELARLQTTDPAKEKIRLATAAKNLEALADHFDEIELLISPEAANAIIRQRDNAKSLREAADLASKVSFADEPLGGVGSDTWRAMWEAAQRYSETEAYPEATFPNTEDEGDCVLCHQPLHTKAKDRLQRFHRFVHNDIAKRALGAEKEFTDALQKLKALEVSKTPTEATLSFLKTTDQTLTASLKNALETAKNAKGVIEQRLAHDSKLDWLDLPKVDTTELRLRATAFREQAVGIDETVFKENVADVTSSKNELEGRLTLSRVRSEIQNEIVRRRELSSLRQQWSKISTQAFSVKSNDLARKYVTEKVFETFVEECLRLKLEHVVLNDKGGPKGKLRHQPALRGASYHTLSHILSEGEQTAAGLAGFFTEVQFDDTKSAVVFDDPMSSLDHERRDLAAIRIVEIARDRQVVVFTHDLMFLGAIMRAAMELDVPLAERTIERNGAKQPGRIIEGHPWKARDAKKRLHDLQIELDRLTDCQPMMSQDQYERSSADWAGKLSETWERIVRSEIAYKLVDRGTTEVRPRMLKVVARITDTDNTDFQTGYGVTSKWARRHDKSEEVNFIPPSIPEMQMELARIKEWHARVRKYENS